MSNYERELAMINQQIRDAKKKRTSYFDTGRADLHHLKKRQKKLQSLVRR